jgi:hypothetical protein
MQTYQRRRRKSGSRPTSEAMGWLLMGMVQVLRNQCVLLRHVQGDDQEFRYLEESRDVIESIDDFLNLQERKETRK